MNVLTTIFARSWDRRIPPRSEIVGRMLLALLGAATALLSFFAQATFTHAMLRAGGWPAKICLVLMGVLSLVLFIDTFVNDLLPVRFHFLWARHRRQFMWMALGLLFMLFAYVVFTANLSPSLGTYLVLYALGSFMLAFVDAAGEKMDRERCATPA